MIKTPRRPVIAATALFALALSVRAGATDYRYETLVEGKRFETTTTVVPAERNGGTIVETVDPETADRHRITLDDREGSLDWTITRGNGDSLAFVRAGGAISVTGVTGGESVGEILPIDEAPWFASLHFGLGPFAREGMTEMEFWTVDPKKFKPYKLVAERKESRVIDVRGSSVAATRVRVSVSGVPAVFFKMDFWMRDSDGLCVRFEGKKGGPGSAKIVSDFMGEEK